MLETLDLEQVTAAILGELIRAHRPVLIFGYGIKLAGAEYEALEVARLLEVPVCPTWGARDVFPDCVGAFGTHGVRAANFAVQNADYILCVGSRLDTKATGSPASSFAPKAKLVMVDVDDAELEKMEKIGRPLNRAVRADARDFLRMLLSWAREYASHNGEPSDYETEWQKRIRLWKEKYPPVPKEASLKDLNPYALIHALGSYISKDDVIVSDTGCVLAWTMQAYPFKGEGFIHAFNQTPMGYGLPAAIGAAFATGKRVVCVTGDGGLSVNITEFATASHHNLPITVILFNNQGHAMCRQTQRQWLNGEYVSTSPQGGVASPDFQDIARAYKFLSYGPNSISGYGIEDALGKVFRARGPAFLEIPIDPEFGVMPQARFGFPIEDQEPALSREELAEAMA
jgi:acetolactate synthase-1/2/3 large subunit